MNFNDPIFKPFSYYLRKSDEELVELIRQGDTSARDTLSVRYWREKNTLVSAVLPNVRDIVDDWDINEAFFVTYLNAEKNFDADHATKFLTYFCEILKNELLLIIAKTMRNNDISLPLSLDTFETLDEDAPTLHELVGSMDEKISGQIDLNDVINLIFAYKDNFPSYTIELAKLLGMGHSVASASKILGVPVSSVKRTLVALRKFLTKQINKLFDPA